MTTRIDLDLGFMGARFVALDADGPTLALAARFVRDTARRMLKAKTPCRCMCQRCDEPIYLPAGPRQKLLARPARPRTTPPTVDAEVVQ